jgi:uncharacterized protein (DUF1778 family)
MAAGSTPDHAAFFMVPGAFVGEFDISVLPTVVEEPLATPGIKRYMSGQCGDSYQNGVTTMSAALELPRSSRRAKKEETIEFRVAPRTKAFLAEAASARHTSMSEFVLSSAVREAENILADQRLFHVSDENWEKFMAILDAPAKPDADIVALARSRTPWGR